MRNRQSTNRTSGELRLGLDYLDRFINDNYTLEKNIDGYRIYRLGELTGRETSRP